MEDLHRHGGVPPGWRFRVPAGDPKTGHEVFAKLECFKCHAIKGESFPGVAKDPGDTGPELTGMGAHHPAEYFAESILNPNAVIVTGPGYTGPDGLSIMPDYRDSLTAGELIDLVAYLKGLAGADAHAHPPGDASVREHVAGEYRVRLEYAGRAAPHAHGAHGGSATKHGHSHLMAFIADAETGAPVPYLPVTATIHVTGAKPRTLRLVPMVGATGFHYGADVTLPPTTTKVTVSIGATTVRVMPGAAGRFATPRRLDFTWP
jgi:hypothetical protein